MSRAPPRLVEWIAGGGGGRGAWTRLALVVAGLFGWFFARGWGGGGLDRNWWLAPLFYAVFLFVPFCLWRLIERRRRTARLREKAVKRLDLG